MTVRTITKLEQNDPHALLGRPSVIRLVEGGLSTLSTEIVDCGEHKIYVEITKRDGKERPTILFVNGALTTTSSLKWAVKSLTDYNIVGFDFPVFGQSLPLNPGVGPLSKEQEVEIVSKLCEVYQPQFVFSFSWGGTSTLLALARQPKSVQKAIVSSYSFGLTDAMRAVSEELVGYIDIGDYERAATATISTLGEFLPDRVKRLFHGYFVSLSPQQVRNVVGQIRYMLSLAPDGELAKLQNINVPILFGNGANDRLTSPESIRLIAHYVRDCEFTVVEGAGHFMAMENKQSCDAACERIRSFFGSGKEMPTLELGAAAAKG